MPLKSIEGKTEEDAIEMFNIWELETSQDVARDWQQKALINPRLPPPMFMVNIIKVEDVTFWSDREERNILEGVRILFFYARS